ncbi:MAG: peptidylprolyl isomerase [Phycisphaerales bacterium JB040]
MRTPTLVVTCLLGCWLGACSGPDRPSPTRQSTQGNGPSQRAQSVGVMWGQRIGWDDLAPSLAEMNGRTALEELAIDRGLSRRLRERGLELTPEMVERERTLMGESLGTQGDGVDRFRRTRGLGPRRFEGLLRRNAMLRLLAGEPEADPMQVRRLYELRHGPRRVCRVLIARNAGEAGAIRERLRTVRAEELEWAFARAAFEESIDPSASAGGYLGAVHPLDPALPSAVREAMVDLEDFELSSVILAEGGALLLLPVGTEPGSGESLETARPELEAEVRAGAQRQAMDTIARDLLREAGVTVLDESLEWGWRAGGR